MGTIRYHISTFRGILKEQTNNSHFPDSKLFGVLNAAKNELRDQSLSKSNKISDFEYRTFCVELERVKSHDCNCVKVGCDVLKSVHPLPDTATSTRKDLLRVLTLGDQLIPNKNEQEIITDNYDDVKAGKPGYMIRNKHLIIWNNLDYKAVQVTGLWENVLDWEGIQLCTENVPCVDVMDLDFDIEGGKEIGIYMRAAQLLGVSMSLPDDQTMNANPNLRQ